MNWMWIRVAIVMVALAVATLSFAVNDGRAVAAADRWCAAARRNEPLIRDAIRMVTASDTSSWGIERRVYGIRPVTRESIVIVKDEEVCHRAAIAYATKRGMSDSGERRVVPVVVVLVDARYLVDDLRSRRRDWEVYVFD